MPIEPPVSCAVSFPLVPRKRLIDLRQRLHRYLGGPQMPWTPCAVQHHHKIAGLRYRLTTSTVIARQAGGGPLDPGDNQIGQFGRDFWGIAKRSDEIIVVIEPGVATKRLPKRLCISRSRRHPGYLSVRALALHRTCTSQRGMQRQMGI